MPRRCSLAIASLYHATRFCLLLAWASDSAVNVSRPKKMPMQPDASIRSSSSSSLATSRLACVRQQLFDVRPVDGQVVVPEPDDLALPPVGKAVVSDVGQDVLDRSHAEAGVERGHGAERAAERAAARRL